MREFIRKQVMSIIPPLVGFIIGFLICFIIDLLTK